MVVADAGHAGRQVGRGGVARRRGALAQEIESAVHGAGAVVHIQAAEGGGPGIGGGTIQAGLVHVTQGCGPELLADGPVAAGGGDRRGAGRGAVKLHHGAVDVGHGFIQTPGLTAVGQVGGGGDNAVAHLVAGDVHGGQGGEAAAVAEGHAEAGVGPEGVVIVVAVVDPDVGSLAGAVDAVTAQHFFEVIPGGHDSEMGVHGCGLSVCGGGGGTFNVIGAIAPSVVGVGVDGAVAGRGMVQVGDDVVTERTGGAARHVPHFKAGSGAVGGQAHGAAVLGIARAGCGRGVEVIPLFQDATRVGINHVIAVDGLGGAVLQGNVDVVSQGITNHSANDILCVQFLVYHSPAAWAAHVHGHGIDHQLSGGFSGIWTHGIQILVGHSERFGDAQGRVHIQADLFLVVRGDAKNFSISPGMGDEIAAPHLDAAIELVETRVGPIEIFIFMGNTHREAVVRIQAHLGPLVHQVVGGALRGNGLRHSGEKDARGQGGSEDRYCETAFRCHWQLL